MNLYNTILKYTMQGFVISFKDMRSHISVRIRKDLKDHISIQWAGFLYYLPPNPIDESLLIKEIEKGIEILKHK